MMSALSQYLLQWQHFFQEMGVLGLLAYVLLIVVVQVFCAPLSPLGIGAGLIFGLGRGLLVVEIGTALGAIVNFLLARYLARERVARWLGSNEKFRLIDAAIGREGWKIVALLRLCPIPFGLANYSYGLTAVRFVPYFLATIFAILPGNFFFVWFGATSHDALATATSGAKAPPGQIVFTVIGMIAFFLALTYIMKIARAAVSRKSADPALVVEP